MTSRPDAPVAAVERARADDGFTLIELMVTLAVIAIGVIGTLSVFLATLDATASADFRAHAQALAMREVEELQAIPYDELGFDDSQDGFVSSFDGATTVEVPSPQSTPTGPVERVDGIDYTIVRHIVWADSTDGSVDRFKRVVAIVTWTDDAGGHQVRVDGGAYEIGASGGAAATTTSTTVVAVTPGTPTNLTAAQSSENPRSQIDLSWVTGVPTPQYWEIQQAADYSDGFPTWVTLTDLHPGGTTTFSAVGLADQTEYGFRVRGVNGEVVGAWSNQASATTANYTLGCSAETATASPGTVAKKNNNNLESDVKLQMAINGANCGSMQAIITTTPGTSYTVNMSNATGSGGVYEYTIGKNDWTTWSTGNKIIVIKQVTTGDQFAEISLLVTN